MTGQLINKAQAVIDGLVGKANAGNSSFPDPDATPSPKPKDDGILGRVFGWIKRISSAFMKKLAGVFKAALSWFSKGFIGKLMNKNGKIRQFWEKVSACTDPSGNPL